MQQGTGYVRCIRRNMARPPSMSFRTMLPGETLYIDKSKLSSSQISSVTGGSASGGSASGGSASGGSASGGSGGGAGGSSGGAGGSGVAVAVYWRRWCSRCTSYATSISDMGAECQTGITQLQTGITQLQAGITQLQSDITRLQCTTPSPGPVAPSASFSDHSSAPRLATFMDRSRSATVHPKAGFINEFEIEKQEGRV